MFRCPVAPVVVALLAGCSVRSTVHNVTGVWLPRSPSVCAGISDRPGCEPVHVYDWTKGTVFPSSALASRDVDAAVDELARRYLGKAYVEGSVRFDCAETSGADLPPHVVKGSARVWALNRSREHQATAALVLELAGLKIEGAVLSANFKARIAAELSSREAQSNRTQLAWVQVYWNGAPKTLMDQGALTHSGCIGLAANEGGSVVTGVAGVVLLNNNEARHMVSARSISTAVAVAARAAGWTEVALEKLKTHLPGLANKWRASVETEVARHVTTSLTSASFHPLWVATHVSGSHPLAVDYDFAEDEVPRKKAIVVNACEWDREVTASNLMCGEACSGHNHLQSHFDAPGAAAVTYVVTGHVPGCYELFVLYAYAGESRPVTVTIGAQTVADTLAEPTHQTQSCNFREGRVGAFRLEDRFEVEIGATSSLPHLKKLVFKPLDEGACEELAGCPPH